MLRLDVVNSNQRRAFLLLGGVPMTPAQVLARYRGRPYDSARIFAQMSGDDEPLTRELGAMWLRAVEEEADLPPVPGWGREADAAAKLLTAAVADGPLHVFLCDERGKPPLPHQVHLTLYLHRHLASGRDLQSLVMEHAKSAPIRLGVRLALRGLPELAHPLAAADSAKKCFGARVDLALDRLADGYPVHPLDAEALASVIPETLLRCECAMTSLPRILDRRLRLPDGLPEAAEKMLESFDDAGWKGAVQVRRRVDAPDRLVAIVRRALEAKGAQFVREKVPAGYFQGRGFGRDGLGPLLLPVSRWMVEGGDWDMRLWTHLLDGADSDFVDKSQRDLSPEARREGVEKRAREILGELLFSIAKDEARAQNDRCRALEAIEILGDGSLAPALGTLRGRLPDSLIARVSRSLAKTTKGHAIDADLAIGDAWRHFMGTSS